MEKNMKENFEKLERRVFDSLNDTDLERINYELSKIDGPTLVSGVGGSSVVSDYASKILSQKNKIITRNTEPRDFRYLDTDIYDFVAEVKSNLVTTKTLGIAFEPEEQFENPNGEPLILDRDFYGNMREKSTIPGPFAFDKSEKTMLNLTNKIAIDTLKM